MALRACTHRHRLAGSVGLKRKDHLKLGRKSGRRIGRKLKLERREWGVDLIKTSYVQNSQVKEKYVYKTVVHELQSGLHQTPCFQHFGL